jgi:hypothetical protein
MERLPEPETAGAASGVGELGTDSPAIPVLSFST